MTASADNTATPRWPGLPEPPSGDFFNETQWAVLMSLIDAVLPPTLPESKVTDQITQKAIPDADYQTAITTTRTVLAQAPDEATLAAYLSTTPSQNPATLHAIRRSLGGVSASARTQLGGVLSALATRPGALLLTGYTTPAHLQPIRVREAILKSWQASWLPSLRLLCKTTCLLAQSSFLTTSPLYQTVSGYPDVPHDWTPPGGKGFPFSFLQFEPGSEPATLETDVVIVGSGCGGGVAAKVLAEAGHAVLVVDKGYHFPPDQLPMPQAEGMHHLFENGGFVTSADTSINVAAGSCWGGGGTVNWSVALQTQGYVRREWVEQHGLPFFGTDEFQDALDRVCGFMGVADAKYQSHRGKVVLDGARRLGWEARPTPQNCGGREHPCGHCHLGCGSGNKQGPAVSWLPDAARNGAEFIEGFKAERVLFEEEGGGGKRATGVVGRWTSRDKSGGTIGPEAERVTREVVIKAKRVIVSSGSLQSPLLLKRSGLKNRHIGRNLHLHPVNFVVAFYDEDVRPWEEGIITSVCTSFENLDNNGHGPKLEPTCMVPYAIMTNLPWSSGHEFKLDVARLRHAAGFISLTRDRDSGGVYADPDTGKPCIEYTPSPFDAANTLEGVLALAKMCYITGAREIRAVLPGTRPFVRPRTTSPESERLGVADPAFVAWLAEVKRAGNRPPFAPYTSAHQMGTCRMSSHAGAGVVDPRGKVWEAEGLYVADASVFPSASGVNPMVTNMAIADWIARGVVRDLSGAK
ncbi:GMC oxidoreductase [Coniochaeta ligniaria NRRL 30616]|uniref:Long-chain-alcohol oxidase n=1 Tax=Coniochaeta ligniaria NRRL 30616 TaxID=1408157 RepID=A0A1J7J1F3_9PEZI|nr:GMC oxidoreductase [Coniochaeta ligniaria NRRL 30616]